VPELFWLFDPNIAPWAAAVFGALVGSFINVVILRLPPRLEYAWRRDARELLELPVEGEPPIGLVVEPSRCPKCGHHLRWWENLPVLSWLALRGRCSNCKTPISWQYPLVELLTALAFAACIWRYGPGLEGLLAMAFSGILIAAAGIDARTQFLPDLLTLPLLWLGLLVATQGLYVPAETAILGAAVGYLSLWLVFQGFLLLTGKEGMGYGDFKLLAALGAWLGWQQLLVVVILASVSGAVIMGTVMALFGRDREIPFAFGPFLAVGGWVAFIGGDQLIGWYFRLFGMA
jgi:leader peptidase (prepilin peptidase)/N-methyltransferase